MAVSKAGFKSASDPAYTVKPQRDRMARGEGRGASRHEAPAATGAGSGGGHGRHHQRPRGQERGEAGGHRDAGPQPEAGRSQPGQTVDEAPHGTAGLLD